MADIFISYKRDEKRYAQALASRLARDGYDVWWDINLNAGDSYPQKIETVLATAKVTIVLWSKSALDSTWVKNEARHADKLGTYLPVLLQDVDPPFDLSDKHALDLKGWLGNPDSLELEQLVDAVRRKIGAPELKEDTSRSQHDLQQEIDAWTGISHPDRKSRKQYRAYLKRFGDDALFGDLARAEISDLTWMKRFSALSLAYKVPVAIVTIVGACFAAYEVHGKMRGNEGLIAVASDHVCPSRNRIHRAVTATFDIDCSEAVYADKSTDEASVSTASGIGKNRPSRLDDNVRAVHGPAGEQDQLPQLSKVLPVSPQEQLDTLKQEHVAGLAQHSNTPNGRKLKHILEKQRQPIGSLASLVGDYDCPIFRNNLGKRVRHITGQTCHLKLVTPGRLVLTDKSGNEHPTLDLVKSETQDGAEVLSVNGYIDEDRKYRVQPVTGFVERVGDRQFRLMLKYAVNRGYTDVIELNGKGEVVRLKTDHFDALTNTVDINKTGDIDMDAKSIDAQNELVANEIDPDAGMNAE
jgi:hypothetical protein